MKRQLYKYNNKNLYKEQIAHLKGYYIDKNGNIYYKGHKRIPKIYGGYKTITIRINGIFVNIKYHRLQAYQKYGDKIYKKDTVVRHLDNNSYNNAFDNITIGTPSQNYYDSLPETNFKRAMCGADAVRKFNHAYIIQLHNNGLSYKEIMKETGIKNKSTISWIINNSLESKNNT